MAVKIKPLRKFSTGTPSANDMEVGEIAVNTADQKIFMKDDNNAVVEVANASGNITGDLLITSTDTDAIEDPSLILYRNSSSPAVDDELGEIVFRGRNDNSENIDYAKVYTEIKDETDGTESGALKFEVMRDGNLTSWMTFSGEANQTYVNKKFNMQSNNILNIGNLTFEGSTSDTNETTLNVTDPTQDRTITLPDASGDVAITQSGVMSIAKIRLSATDDVSASSTLQALQIGPTNSFNIAMDNNEIMARNNGSVSNLKLNDGALEVGSSGATITSNLTLTSTDAGATDGPTITLKRDSSSPANFDDIGEIKWIGENSASEEIRYGHIKTQITSPTDSQEESRMVFSIYNDGAEKEMMFLDAAQGGGSMYLTSGIDIIFEGTTANTHETTLTVTDPTTDRTITLPDATGTVHTTANPEINGAYGSSSAPRIFKVTVATQTAAHPYNGDGSTNKYSIDGIQGAALTLHGADDDTSNSEYIYRFDQSDSSNNGHPIAFYLQADKTNQYTTGVTTSGTPGQAGAYVQIAVTKSTPKTLFYQCANHAYMGNYVTVANSTKFTADNVVGTDTVTATKLRLTSPTNATGSATTHAFQIGAAGTANLRLDNNQIAAYGSSGSGNTFYINPQGGQVNVGSGGLALMTDGNDIKFGSNQEITLTHVHDTGLLLTDSGGSPTLQLHDSNESVSSDGTNLILTSGGTAFKMPTSDGTGGHFLKTDGSGNLSFAAASGGTASDSFSTIAVSGQSNVVADSSTDTLTLVAGNNMTITTNASGDSIEFAASGGAGSGISEEQAIAFAIVYG